MDAKTKLLNTLLKATEKMIELEEKELALEFVSELRDLVYDHKLEVTSWLKEYVCKNQGSLKGCM